MHLVVYSDSSIYGGAEVSLGTLLSELDPGIHVTMLGTNRAVVERVASARSEAATLVIEPVAGRRDLRGIFAHLRAVRRLRPDVFQANLISPWSCRYGILAALLTPGTRVVAVEHLPGPATAEFPRRRKRLFSKLLAAHVAVGERTARELEARIHLRPGAIRSIPNGVADRPLTAPPRTREGATVGSLGRLDRQKGYDVLLDALPTLPAGTAVVVVGDGPERSALEQQADRLGVSDRFHLVGRKENARDYLASFDLFVLPSRFEGLPLVLIDAMLAELAVVATDVGSTSEAVQDGRTGLLVPAEDAEELGRALNSLLGEPRQRKQLGRAGRVVALEAFSAPRQARAYELLYEEILGASAKDAPGWR
jgi:glycosyltransferase involved in cell wall biosynthesis